MVLVQFHCPHCTGIFQVDSSHGGSQVLCPTCSGVVTVPVLEDESPGLSEQGDSGSIDDVFGTTASVDAFSDDAPVAPEVYQRHEPREDLAAIDDLLPPGAAETGSAPAADDFFTDASFDRLSGPDPLTGADALSGQVLLPPSADEQNLEPVLPKSGPSLESARGAAQTIQNTDQVEVEERALLDVIVVAPRGEDEASSNERERQRARRNLIMLVLGVAVLVAAVLVLRHV